VLSELSNMEGSCLANIRIWKVLQSAGVSGCLPVPAGGTSM